MNIELVQQLKQQQILAPQMILSMDILLLTHQELEARIEKEFMENPALELAERPQGEDGAGEDAAPPSGNANDPSAASVFEHLESFQNLPQPDLFSRSFEQRSRRVAGVDFDRQEALQNLEGEPPGLRDHLAQQLRMLDVDPEVADVTEFLIHEIDDRGYLLHSAASLRETLEERGVPAAVFDAALRELRAMDPAGVGAENLQECLRIQLERDGQEYPVEIALLQNHVEDLRNNKLPKIARELGKTIDEVKDALEILAMLDPYPGREFASHPRQYIRPDVIVEEVDGEFKISVEDQEIQPLQVSDTCRSLLHEHRRDRQVSQFLRRKIDSAQWLIQAIRQRRQTIRDIAGAIVQYQIDFMRRGSSHLRAMKMQTIADVVGVHISTISRAIKGKYMQTPVGLFDMKYFFTGGVERADGELESRRNVFLQIQEIIDGEDKRKPLSDTAIARILKGKGLDIARRTVTKYRDQEGIQPSRLRRQF